MPQNDTEKIEMPSTKSTRYLHQSSGLRLERELRLQL